MNVDVKQVELKMKTVELTRALIAQLDYVYELQQSHVIVGRLAGTTLPRDMNQGHEVLLVKVADGEYAIYPYSMSAAQGMRNIPKLIVTK